MNSLSVFILWFWFEQQYQLKNICTKIKLTENEKEKNNQHSL